MALVQERVLVFSMGLGADRVAAMVGLIDDLVGCGRADIVLAAASDLSEHGLQSHDLVVRVESDGERVAQLAAALLHDALGRAKPDRGDIWVIADDAVIEGGLYVARGDHASKMLRVSGALETSEGVAIGDPVVFVSTDDHIEMVSDVDRGDLSSSRSRRTAERSAAYRVIAVMGVIGVLWSAIQVQWAAVLGRRLFFDEGLFLTIGRRTLEGGGISDRYLTWVTGSLGYGVLAATAESLGGVVGARMLSGALVAVSAILVADGVRTVAEPRVAIASGVAVLATTPALFAGHLIAHDVLAASLLAVSFNGALRFRRDGRRGTLFVVALALAAAGIAKYFAAAMFLPVLVLLFHRCRPKTAASDVVWFFCAFMTPVLVYVSVFRSDLVELLNWNPLVDGGGFGPAAVTFELLVVFGWVLPSIALGFRSAERHLGSAGLEMRWAMLLALLLLPALHVATGTHHAAVRQSLYGLIFAAPLLGSGLMAAIDWARSSSARRAALVLCGGLSLAMSVVTARVLDHEGADLRPVFDVLASEVARGETIAAQQQWSLVGVLYPDVMSSPWDIQSEALINLDGESICSFDWVVFDTSNPWSSDATQEFEGCSNEFRQIAAETGSVTWLFPDLRWEELEVEVTVFQHHPTDSAAR